MGIADARTNIQLLQAESRRQVPSHWSACSRHHSTTMGICHATTRSKFYMIIYLPSRYRHLVERQYHRLCSQYRHLPFPELN
ncbi:hypothetical protein BYT27DRAFT_6547564 [Phlegmacium glaucopus]|nr:hypothetical protein BYT27DRAFT_6547564 [Phlegmacium glaucopus]